jgi:Spy/CpxP family protein refolding chaperone
MDQMHTLMEAKRDGTITPEQQEQLKTLRQQGKEKAQSIHQQIQAILTPEQIAQIEKNKQERKERWEQRRQQGEPNKPQTPDKPTDN